MSKVENSGPCKWFKGLYSYQIQIAMAHGYKTGGRSAGTPNKKTSIGKLVEQLLEKELTNINNYLNNLNNKERIEVILKLLPYATPKLTRQEKQGVEEQPDLPLFLED